MLKLFKMGSTAYTVLVFSISLFLASSNLYDYFFIISEISFDTIKFHVNEPFSPKLKEELTTLIKSHLKTYKYNIRMRKTSAVTKKTSAVTKKLLSLPKKADWLNQIRKTSGCKLDFTILILFILYFS